MEYNLNRFVEAQNRVYEQVLKELKQGKKISHWMWYIFPQIQGLGYTSSRQYYAISSLEEAKEYVLNPILNSRLIECCQILLELENKTVEEIFNLIDTMKLKSCMTLFSLASDNPIFDEVLKMYFDGEKDSATVSIAESDDLIDLD